MELAQLGGSEQRASRTAQNHPEGGAGGPGVTAQLLRPSGHQHFPDVIFRFLHAPLQVRLLLLQDRKPRGELRSTLAPTAHATVLGPKAAWGRAAKQPAEGTHDPMGFPKRGQRLFISRGILEVLIFSLGSIYTDFEFCSL